MPPKTISLYLFSFLLVFSIFSNSEVAHWPQICDGGELVITNKSNQTQTLWLQKFGKALISETDLEVTARTTATFSLTNLAEDERYSLLFFVNKNYIDIKHKCDGKSYSSTTLEGGSLTFKKSNLSTNHILIRNLYTGVNQFDIEYQSEDFKTVASQQLNLKSLEKLKHIVPSHISNWAYFKISSTYKASIFNLNSRGAELPILVMPKETQVDNKASYFLIAPRSENSDSFVVKITDVNMIQRARDLISSTENEKIIFAKIQKDHKGFNRNWNSTEKNLWSWSASEVTNIADLGSTACNGLPQIVEDRMDYWVEDPGRICFWSYRFKKELTPMEVSTGILNSKR